VRVPAGSDWHSDLMQPQFRRKPGRCYGEVNREMQSCDRNLGETTMIISVFNNKGGVGKSIITQNLAHALASKGKKVLVIDQDPRSNTTSVLIPPSGANTLFNLYRLEVPAFKCIYPTSYNNIDILPNTIKTESLQISLCSDVEKSYFLLRDSIREYALQNYDICLIDCPQNLGLYVKMALICSDSTIVPVAAGSQFSIDGFVSVLKTIEAISKTVPHPHKFIRAVINKVDLRNSIHKSSVDDLYRTFEDKIFKTTIPKNTVIMHAEMERKTVLSYAPHCTVAKRFKSLANELLEIISEQ
jgi:chromosome partitioning protein